MAELWDLFDANGNHKGTMRRGIDGVPKEKGLYHKAVEVIVTDCHGHILLVQRPWNKKTFPGCLEFPTGSAIAGESPEAAAKRTVREETGLELEKLAKIQSSRTPGMIIITYLGLVKNLTKSEIRLLPEEAIAYRIVTHEQWLEVISNRLFNVNRYRQYGPNMCKLLPKLIGKVPDTELPAKTEGNTTAPTIPAFHQTNGITVSANASEESMVSMIDSTAIGESEDSK